MFDLSQKATGQAGVPAKLDYEYVRNGPTHLFVPIEPRRDVSSSEPPITGARRTLSALGTETSTSISFKAQEWKGTRC
jgi:hypothetical protein